MNKMVARGLAHAGFLAGMALAQAQVVQAAHAAPEGAGEPNEVASETRPVDARVVRVHLEGVVDLRIRQGAPARLVLRGEPRWLAKTTSAQDGDTLNIDTEVHGRVQLGNLHAELVLPALREVSSDGLGAADIAGFTGEELVLNLGGAGSMRVSASYRIVRATLGGIGSLNLQGLNGEGVDVNLQGAGVVTLGGRTRWLKADLGGLGNLDAQQLAADVVTIDLSGLGNASVTARQNANLDLSGLGSVTVYGKPLNRKVTIDGLGKVKWK